MGGTADNGIIQSINSVISLLLINAISALSHHNTQNDDNPMGILPIGTPFGVILAFYFVIPLLVTGVP